MIGKKQQSTVWLFPDEAPPQNVKCALSAGKQMVDTFVSGSGHIATITLLEQKTVTKDSRNTILRF